MRIRFMGAVPNVVKQRNVITAQAGIQSIFRLRMA